MSKRYKYTKEDEDFLRQYYPICDWKSIEERFLPFQDKEYIGNVKN